MPRLLEVPLLLPLSPLLLLVLLPDRAGVVCLICCGVLVGRCTEVPPDDSPELLPDDRELRETGFTVLVGDVDCLVFAELELRRLVQTRP